MIETLNISFKKSIDKMEIKRLKQKAQTDNSGYKKWREMC